MRPTLSVLIVAWNSREELGRTLPALLPELRDGDELIVVDNGSERRDRRGGGGAGAGGAGRSHRAATSASPPAATPAPRGDAATCWSSSTPTRRRCPGFGEAIRRPWLRGPRLGGLAGAGRRGDGATGSTRPATRSTSPASSGPGGHGRPIAEAPAAGEVTALSGACLAIPPRTWRGSAASRSASSSTTRTSTSRCACGSSAAALGIEPAAVVDHDYEFGAREHKWRWLERNRWAFLSASTRRALLVLLAPGPARHRAGADPGLHRRRLGQPEARRDLEVAALAPPAAARAAPGPGHPHRHHRRVRLLAHPRPRLPLHPRDRPLAPRAARAARLLACVRLLLRGVRVTPADRSAGSGSR